VTRATGFTTATSYGSGGNMVAVRGFTDSSVAFLYDGIRNAAELGNLGWPYDPWTVERIEVLNGPASVLYGIGGIGGSINIIPRRPNRSAEHTVSLSGGSFDTYKLALDSTGPLSERVLYRVDVSRQQSDGYINQGTSEGTVVSGSLTFLLSDTPSIQSPRTEAPGSPKRPSSKCPQAHARPAARSGGQAVHVGQPSGVDAGRLPHPEDRLQCRCHPRHHRADRDPAGV
jgi:outer membrane receptor protein involved in Fe transport